MKRLFLFILFPVSVFGQALNGLNYQYLYGQDNGFTFSFRKQNLTSDSVSFYFSLKNESPKSNEDFIISLFIHESLNAKDGKEIRPNISYIIKENKLTLGKFSIRESDAYLVFKIIHLQKREAWLYFSDCKKELISFLPIEINDTLSTKKFVPVGSKISLHQNKGPFFVNFYRENFPAASPPYTEVQNMVAKNIKPDSSFQVANYFITKSNGLYLIQKDSTSKESVSIRVEDDYPKFRKLTSLTAPFAYVTTKAEFNKIAISTSDKRSFDRSILAITGDAERAKFFMRNYFKRVELANLYFTGYKEGWKTDRGMIFTIFGLPDGVYKTQTSEIWEYRTQGDKVSFTFVKTPTLFDPDNYVLIRKNKLEPIWLEAVDLNRNARF